MDSGFELKLIDCLSLLDDGEPVERILARYPDEAEQLRAILEVATALPALRLDPSEAARVESRRAFLNQAHDLRETVRPRRFWLPARLAIGLAALALAFVFVGGAVSAASSALPNDPLYSVKRGVEDARLLLASQAERASLARQFEQRRRDEVARLLDDRGTAAVAFDGQLQELQPGRWIVSGLMVRLDPATAVTGTPGIDARLHVQGHTENGQLHATSIQIEPGTGLLLTATPTVTPSESRRTEGPTATTQPSATHVPTPTATATARPSATPTPRLAPSPTATLIPAPAPTARPEPTAALPTQAPLATQPPAPPTQESEQEVEVEFSGTVESIGSVWRIGGRTVEIDGSTEIRDTMNVGDSAKVRAVRLADGRLIARRIERLDSHDGNQNGNGSGVDDHSGGDNTNGTDDHGGGGDNTNSTDDHGGGSGDSGGGGSNDSTNGSGANDHGGGSGGDGGR
jgi:hypothetical protein